MLIKVLHQEKGCGSKKLLAEFPNKTWSQTSLKRLPRKGKSTLQARSTGSTAVTESARLGLGLLQNNAAVEEFAMSLSADGGTLSISCNSNSNPVTDIYRLN